MRRKKNILDVVTWRFYRPHKCNYCEKDAVGTLWVSGFFKQAERDLCEECIHKWINGELYI
jgi:hypothetical protein